MTMETTVDQNETGGWQPRTEALTAELVQRLTENVEYVRGCCLDKDAKFSVSDVLALYTVNDGAGHSESETVCVFVDADGRYSLFEQSEDYTGHGCQCFSSITTGSSDIAEFWRLTLTDSHRDRFRGEPPVAGVVYCVNEPHL